MLDDLSIIYDCGLFKWLGALYFLQFLAANLTEFYRGFMNYIWSCFAPPKNFVKEYGEWAIVTGGSDGIGKQVAFELAAKKMNVLILSNVEEDLKAVSSEIEKKYGVKSKWLCVDFSDFSCYDDIKKCLDDLGDIGVLVNNVGITNENMETVPRQPETLIKKMVLINALACVMMTRIVTPAMMDKRKGLIVNIGSKAGVSVLPRSTIYCATKAFVRKFTECVIQEVEKYGVEMTCVEPYLVRTGLLLRGTKSRAMVNSMPRFAVPTPTVFARSIIRVLNVHVPLFFSGFWLHGLTGYCVNSQGGIMIEKFIKTIFAKSTNKKA